MDPAELLKKYQERGYNILTPSITLEGLSEHHKATVETVSLSPDKNVGDVYPHRKEEGGTKTVDHQFRVAKQGLDKLAVLAGVIWHEQDGSRRIDDRSDMDYVAFEAFGAIRKADGQLVPVKAFYDLDFKAIEDDLEYLYRSTGAKGKYAKQGKALDDHVVFCVGRDMRSKRKHRATLCESGARNRVIRALLGIKKIYTGRELSFPFVCLRITYQPDYNDPEVKRLMTLASIGAQANIYGIAAQQPQLPEPDSELYEDAVPVAEELPADDNVTEPNGVDDEEPPPMGNDFENWDRRSKETHITNLAKKKGYDLAGLLKRMDTKLTDFDNEQLLSLSGKLEEMKAKIPF